MSEVFLVGLSHSREIFFKEYTNSIGCSFPDDVGHIPIHHVFFIYLHTKIMEYLHCLYPMCGSLVIGVSRSFMYLWSFDIKSTSIRRFKAGVEKSFLRICGGAKCVREVLLRSSTRRPLCLAVSPGLPLRRGRMSSEVSDDSDPESADVLFRFFLGRPWSLGAVGDITGSVSTHGTTTVVAVTSPEYCCLVLKPSYIQHFLLHYKQKS